MRVAMAALLLLLAPGCRRGAGQVTPRSADGDVAGAASDATPAAAAGDASGEALACPDLLPAPTPLPGVREEQRTRAYWLERAAAYGPPDEVLLSADRIADHDRALRIPFDGWPLGWSDLDAAEDPRELQSELAAPLRAVRDDMASGPSRCRHCHRVPRPDAEQTTLL